MSTRTHNYLEAIEHLPEGATLVFQNVTWDDYEALLHDLDERPGFRVAYDQGRLEIMSTTAEHEKYGRFIDALVRVFVEPLDIYLESYGSTTWRRRVLLRGLEPDCCYYVANAELVMSKIKIDLEEDPPPDIAVEIDITNESLSKFSIYAALGVPEIWRYDSKIVQFYELVENSYREISESRFVTCLKPSTLAVPLEQSKTDGQTATLRAFRKSLNR